MLYSADVHTTLLSSMPSLTRQQLESILVYGPDRGRPTPRGGWCPLPPLDVNTPFPVAWSLGVSLALSALFALAWERAFGQGPVEMLMNAVVRPVRRALLGRESRSSPSP